MDNGSRNYDVAGQRLPSVTTILGKTKDDTFLKNWIKKKGKEEAERIANEKEEKRQKKRKDKGLVGSRSMFSRAGGKGFYYEGEEI